MKNYDKNIESSYLMYLDANNLYGWAMSQKLPIDGFKWVEDLSKFNENFIKNYDENSNKGYFLEVDVEYPKNLFNLHKVFHFYLKERKLKNVMLAAYTTKKLCCSHKSFKTSIKSK